MDSHELQHWGIKGMRWGVRRYQNKDGSLTAAGKKRRREQDDDDRQETNEERRARALRSTDAKEIYKNRDVLTTAEINERINRIDTEARLSRLAESTVKTGRDQVNEKMRSATETINNARNLFASVDVAYSTLANSAIAKTLAKKLGIEPPKNEFNLDDFWKNRKTKSAQEMMEANRWLMAEESIKQTMDRRNRAAKAEQTKKDAQKQVDDYVNSGAKDDRVSPSTYNKKGDDITDNKTATGKSSGTNRLGIEQKERYEATGDDVIGEGTSRFSGWDRNVRTVDAEEGRDYWSANDTVKNQTASESTALISAGRTYLLEDRSNNYLLEDRNR